MTKRKIIILSSILVITIVLAFSASYALFRFNVTKNTNFKLTLGTLELVIKDTTTEDKFVLTNVVPMKDETALEQKGYTFTLTNTGTIDSYYSVYLDDILLDNAGNRLENSYIRINLLNEKTGLSSTKYYSELTDEEGLLENGFLKVGESITYTFHMWLKYDAGNEAQNKYFATQIRVVGTQANAVSYKESLLNGADPVLSDNLIPVTIADGTVTYADVKNKWYSYEDKIWANAVILKNNVTHSVGEIIPESDIKQYYVWIPRYKYQLWNVNGENKYSNGTEKESAINIVFESKTATPSNGTQNEEWLTHPAFTSFDTDGIWVGKFETSYDEETYTDSSKFLTTNPNYLVATEATNIIIKPNVRSLTNKDVSTFYTLGRGINEGLNSHMMKNSEWGAVAYLTYSLYGKCTETGCEEVYLNNINTGYLNSSANFTGQWQYGATITGCSASTVSATVNSNKSACELGYAYNEINNKASTTGNISGIYDMSGGNWEYVMGVLEDSNGLSMSGRNSKYNSGFNGTYGCPTCNSDTSGLTSLTTGINFPADTRYYDIYTANSTELGDNTWYKYENGHLGDGTKEIAVSQSNASSGDKSLWYSDYANFPTVTDPWFFRGGNFHNVTGAGVLNFARNYGHTNGSAAFRVVLSPSK